MILYGQETEKALEILGAGQTPREIIEAYGEVKLAAIRAQQETASLYPGDYFPFLEETAAEIIRGDLDKQFPLPLSQAERGQASI